MLSRQVMGSDVGRAGLEPATNGLLAPTQSLSDQAKRLAETHQIAYTTP
jgi:hypothetical protein